MSKNKAQAEETDQDSSDSPQERFAVKCYESALLDDGESRWAVVVYDLEAPEQSAAIERVHYRILCWMKKESQAIQYCTWMANYLDKNCGVSFAIELTNLAYYQGTESIIEECPVCSGSKKLQSHTCYRCSGRGVIAV